MRDNLLSVGGNPEIKELKEMLPEILKQVGPQQYTALRDLVDQGSKSGAAAAGDDADDVPPLVEGTFESPAKWKSRWFDGREKLHQETPPVSKYVTRTASENKQVPHN